MATSVYGEAITDETLRKLSDEYKGKQISRMDRARVAVQKMHDDYKDVEAREYGERQFGLTGTTGTICMIYNATGGPVTLVDHKSWSGNVGMAPYPQRLENGQWGVFYHGKLGSTASKASVIYDGKNAYDTTCQWIFGWSNDASSDNRCCVKVHESSYSGQNWSSLSDDLDKGKLFSRENVSRVTANGSIGTNETARFEGIMSLEGAW